MSSEDIKCEDEAGKLFVGGLSWETSKESLSSYFEAFGHVVDCVVMKNNDTGKSRGFGFVTFKDPMHVDAVLNEPQHILDNRAIDPKPCNPRSAQLKKKNNNFKVFLGGLPNNVTESDLQAFFSNYGSVTEVNIMYDQEQKKCRGFGFLSFDSEDAVKKACADHFVHIKGKQVECKMAVTRSSGGGGMGAMNGRGGGGGGMQGMGQMWNPMGGPMQNNGMGPNGGCNPGWGANQQSGGFQGGFNQGPGYQNYGYSYNNSQPQFGSQQGYGNYGGNASNGGSYGYGNYGGMPGNGPQGGSQGGQGYMGGSGGSGGSGMGQNQMGGPGMAASADQYSNMGNYPHEPSNYGPSRGFGGGPMGQGGMQNSGFMPPGGYSQNQSASYDGMGGAQSDGPPGGRGGAQQNTGYHPYRR